jgi:pimeloyl-ACP methyl ester carboxylesterase
MTRISSHTARTGSARIHYRRAGARGGPSIVLLHGWPETSHVWRSVVPHLQDFDLIMPDLRGLGESSIPATGYDKDTIAADIETLLADVTATERSLVVGHDWGGVVAFFLANRLRERCTGLVVLDVTVPGSPSIDFSQDGRRWHHRFSQVEGLAETLVGARPDEYYRYFFDTFGSRPGVVDDEAIAEYLRTYRDPRRIVSGLSYYRAIAQDIRNAQEVLRDKLPMPVLALGGADSFGRGEEPKRSLGDFAVDVEGFAIPDCGHWIPEEAPLLLADELRKFATRVFK